MRYSTTDRGIARGRPDGLVDLLDVDDPDLGAVLRRDPSLGELATAPVDSTVALDELTVLAPVHRPGKVVCMGINYQSHVDEIGHILEALGQEVPDEPVFFTVPSSAVAAPDADIVLPAVAPTMVDYEIEVAAIVGRGGKEIAPEDVWSHIAGLTLANDVSARDLQTKAMTSQTHELAHAKGLDGFKPMGPSLVTIDEFELPLEIAIEAKVNGEVRQRASTADMLHDIPASVAHLSRFFTLEPGDVILTGSPAGVGFSQGKFLAPGDVVELSAEGIGTMTQRVVAAD